MSWATRPCAYEGARLLFQIIADSYEKRSIIHHGRIIRFTGESYRNTHSLMNN